MFGSKKCLSPTSAAVAGVNANQLKQFQSGKSPNSRSLEGAVDSPLFEQAAPRPFRATLQPSGRIKNSEMVEKFPEEKLRYERCTRDVLRWVRSLASGKIDPVETAKVLPKVRSAFGGDLRRRGLRIHLPALNESSNGTLTYAMHYSYIAKFIDPRWGLLFLVCWWRDGAVSVRLVEFAGAARMWTNAPE